MGVGLAQDAVEGESEIVLAIVDGHDEGDEARHVRGFKF
jgi:hypothetical protein